MQNKIRQIIEAKGITAYRFWKDTGVARATAFRLAADPSYIPGNDAMDKICRAYGLDAGDLLEFGYSHGAGAESTEDNQQ